MSYPAVLVLMGPTASGKSALAMALARRFDAEIVSADSRQIYRGMPIGTALPSDEERASVPHHCIDFLDPKERFSAAQFCNAAMDAIENISARAKRAIVVGGTGFYVRALAGDVDLAGERDPLTRERLEREAKLHPLEFLYAWLQTRDPARAAALAPADRYRIERALEVALAPQGKRAAIRTLRASGIPYRKFALRIAAADLQRNIRNRSEAMLRRGLLEEAKRVAPGAVAASALGYPLALAYENGWCTRAELLEGLVRSTQRYAKRQQTWLRSEPDVTWIDYHEAQCELNQRAQELPGWNSKAG